MCFAVRHEKTGKTCVFPGSLTRTHTTAAAFWSKHTGMGHLLPEKAQFAWNHPQFSANQENAGVFPSYSFFCRPVLNRTYSAKIPCSGSSSEPFGPDPLLIPDFPEPAATSRFIAYLSQSRKYYYNRQSMKLQPLFRKIFQIFCGFFGALFPAFFFARYFLIYRIFENLFFFFAEFFEILKNAVKSRCS